MKITINTLRIILLTVACILSLALILSIFEFVVNNAATAVDIYLLKQLAITVSVSFLLWFVVHSAYKSIEF